MKTNIINPASEKEKAFWNIVTACGLLTHNMQNILKAYGLSVQQYALLNLIKKHSNESITMTQLDVIGISSDIDILPTLSELEINGYVALNVLTANVRVEKLISLTQKANKTMETVAIQKVEIEKYLSGLSEFELSIFNKMIVKLTTVSEQQAIREKEENPSGTSTVSAKYDETTYGNAPMPLAEPRHRQ